MLATASLLSCEISAHAQCFEWKNGFEAPGIGGDVHALAVFDDGSGPAVYAGGYFPTAGATIANSISKWDGSQWSALSREILGTVHAVIVFELCADG